MTSRTANQETAAELVASIRAGDGEAEETLYRRYRRGLWMILSQMALSREDAEDLLQEAFRLGLAKIRAGELRQPERLPQFLNSLARNLAIHHYRREGRRRGDENLEAVERTYQTPPGQFDRLYRRQKASLAVEVLDELRNDRDRELLYRFYIAEDEKAEICGDLNLSSLHFNRVLHRARQRYRVLYEKAVAGPRGSANPAPGPESG